MEKTTKNRLSNGQRNFRFEKEFTIESQTIESVKVFKYLDGVVDSQLYSREQVFHIENWLFGTLWQFL